MSKAGPILALIGGILILVGGVINMGINSLFLFINLISGEDLGFGVEFSWITTITTMGIGIVTIILSRQLKKENGFGKAALILIIIGVIAAIGTFIEFLPIRTIPTGEGLTDTLPAVTLTTTFLFVDPYLIIMGGIIDLMAVPPEIVAQVKNKT